MVIAGRVQDVQGPRVPAIIGGLLMCAGFIYAGLMTNAIVFYLGLDRSCSKHLLPCFSLLG